MSKPTDEDLARVLTEPGLIERGQDDAALIAAFHSRLTGGEPMGDDLAAELTMNWAASVFGWGEAEHMVVEFAPEARAEDDGDGGDD